MMNKLIIVTCLAVTLTISSIASATPEWRGTPGSTYQEWYFSTPDTMLPPNVVNNPYGTPGLRVNPFGDWFPNRGAWTMGEIDIWIPNLGMQNPQKIIQIQLMWQPVYYDPFLPSEPIVGITTNPAPYNIMIASRIDNQIGEDWISSTYNILIWPNPYEEWIIIKGDILVDQLVIDTLCVPVPEPATVCLLGLGTLTLLRRNRGYGA